MAQSFGLAMGIVGRAIGGVLCAAGGTIAGGIAGSLTSFYDNQCGGKGVFININWILQVHATPVC